MSSTTHKDGLVARIRRLLAADGGAANPFIVVGAVMIFGIVSVAFLAALQTTIAAMQTQKVNTALATQINGIAMREAAQGYHVVSMLPQRSVVSVAIAGTSVDAIRTIVSDHDMKTARVTISVGRYVPRAGWLDPEECDIQPSDCLFAAETATPGLSHTFPDLVGIAFPDPPFNNVAGTNEGLWADVAVGTDHTLAVDVNGEIWAWGNNVRQQLGDGTSTARSIPVKLDTGTVRFSSVHAGDQVSYAIDTTERLWTWGWNEHGRAAGGSPDGRPNNAPGTGYLRMDAGGDAACAIVRNDRLEIACWGNNSASRLSPSAPVTISTPMVIRPADDPNTMRDEAQTSFVQLAVGANHQLAIDEDGKLWAWGSNSHGQLGFAISAPGVVSTPRLVAARSTGDDHILSATSVIEIYAVGNSSYAVDSFGRLWAWGQNNHGQLGVGDTINHNSPVRAAEDITVSRVAASTTAAYAITRLGGLYAWGLNSDGQLGVDPENPGTILTPTRVTEEASFMSAFAPAGSGAGSNRVVALDSSQRIWSWGSGSSGNAWGDGDIASPDRPTPIQSRFYPNGGGAVIDISARGEHVLALDENSALWAWGENGSGQLGTGSTDTATELHKVVGQYTSTPVAVSVGTTRTHILGVLGDLHSAGFNSTDALGIAGNASYAPASVSGQYAQISAQDTVTVAVDRDGGVWSWGRNNAGQLGNGSSVTSSRLPVAVSFPGEVRIVQVAAGAEFGLALDADGRVWSWGSNNAGQLGTGLSPAARNTPALVGGGLSTVRIIDIGAGAQHALAVDSSGQVWVWGSNEYRQIISNLATLSFSTPTLNPQLSGIIQVDGGESFSVALGGDGTAYSLGEFDAGSTPQAPVQDSIAEAITSVSANAHTVLAITDSGVWGWGRATPGPLGTRDGSTGLETAPVQIYSGAVLAAATGGDSERGHTVIVAGDGTVFALGDNSAGQLGAGSTGAEATPLTQLPAWHTAAMVWASNYGTGSADIFERIYTGESSSAAIDDQGHLWVWGSNANGLLGAGSSATTVPTPAVAPIHTRVVAAAFGVDTLLAVDANGQLWRAGRTATQPDVRAIDRFELFRLPAKIVAVDAGEYHVVALSDEGEVYGWGGNTTPEPFGAGSPTFTDTAYQADASDIASLLATRSGTLLVGADGTITVWGDMPWGGAAGLAGSYSFFASSPSAGIAAVTDDDYRAIHSHGYAVTALTVVVGDAEFSQVSSARFAKVQAGTTAITALDSNGNVWVWGTTTPPFPEHPNAEPTIPALVPYIGDPADVSLRPQSEVLRTSTVWQIATIDLAAAAENIQVNVKSPARMASVIVNCGNTRVVEVPAMTSFGRFQHANIDLTTLSACATGALTLAAILDGAPAAAGQVEVVVLPLVDVSHETVTW